MIDEIYSVEYGEYMLRYRIEGDPDGNKAFIETIASEYGTIDKVMFDDETIDDMLNTCVLDFLYKI